MAGRSRIIADRWKFRPSAGRGISRSSWTATAAGPQRQNLPRIDGHAAASTSVRRTTEECARLKIEQLTLYCLSSENWKRPQTEIDFLMHLLEQYMIEERATIMEQQRPRADDRPPRRTFPSRCCASWTRRSR